MGATAKIQERPLSENDSPETSTVTILKEGKSAPANGEAVIVQGAASIATFAHELKTPIAIISGYVELLLSEGPGALSETQRQILQDVLQNCLRLKRFAGDFLTYSALAGEKYKLRLEIADINACLGEVCGYWLEQFRSRNMALIFPPNPVLEQFQFDYFKTQRVVSNLIENAFKYTPAGGTVWVTAEIYEPELRCAQEPRPERTDEGSADAAKFVKVSVSDTGPGIPAEYRAEIFNDFFRVPAQQGEVEGTGLGLAIARRIVQAHGGRIWVDCDSVSGTRVSFLLPMRQ